VHVAFWWNGMKRLSTVASIRALKSGVTVTF